MKACLTCFAGLKMWLVVASHRGSEAHASLRVRHLRQATFLIAPYWNCPMVFPRRLGMVEWIKVTQWVYDGNVGAWTDSVRACTR
ncbi:hypothetical protein BDP81DRAFT_441557 [Colletotrichum phormii]|uniref:Secreted protein n=1 Tax=Colletotrichum phormii TaxID=359342 RepID=A0AAJ0EA65_9PEZI|nr:uncharacterized protein BDP81DRAFT_441557 [Colletotrichum phormii]KAK1622367.1 hypothetical protein BDP81DRAFT_441557 [Colletotrichum phormii]